ncbi:MAG: alkaline phosphatase family protein [Myxococcota bacterium]|nr:alkaline phosphatase family protein [Myxococcota bacterium]
MFIQSIRASLAPVAISLAVLLAGCSEEPPTESRGRVLLIGIDGASPRIVDPLIAEGRLPNLAGIAREGVHGKLRSAEPIHSPRIWNTIVTGVVPEKHGIVTFSYGGRDGRQHLYTSRHRRARALWTIASAAGLEVAVVNFWNTYPLEKVNGVMVSDHILATQIDEREQLTGAAKARVGDVIYPPAWNGRLSGMIEARATPIPDFESPFVESRTLPRWVLRDELQRRFEEDGALAQMTLEILREERPDVTLVLLPGIDRISHYLWGVIEPPGTYSEGLEPTAEGRAGGKAALYRYYEYVDALVGHLAADFGPNDLVMVLSDHGFEAHEAMMRLTGNHHTEKAIDGIIYTRGAGLPSGEEVTGLGVNDIAPTLLRWMQLPVARDMDGKAASFVADPGVAPVPSYNEIALEFVTPKDAESGAEEEVIERLKALGYIESE